MNYKGIEITWKEAGEHAVASSIHPKGYFEFLAPLMKILYWFDTEKEAREYIDYLDEVGILY